MLQAKKVSHRNSVTSSRTFEDVDTIDLEKDLAKERDLRIMVHTAK